MNNRLLVKSSKYWTSSTPPEWRMKNKTTLIWGHSFSSAKQFSADVWWELKHFSMWCLRFENLLKKMLQCFKLLGERYKQQCEYLSIFLMSEPKDRYFTLDIRIMKPTQLLILHWIIKWGIKHNFINVFGQSCCMVISHFTNWIDHS